MYVYMCIYIYIYTYIHVSQRLVPPGGTMILGMQWGYLNVYYWDEKNTYIYIYMFYYLIIIVIDFVY